MSRIPTTAARTRALNPLPDSMRRGGHLPVPIQSMDACQSSKFRASCGALVEIARVIGSPVVAGLKVAAQTADACHESDAAGSAAPRFREPSLVLLDEHAVIETLAEVGVAFTN